MPVLTTPTNTEAELKGVDLGGLIREDVMNKIWDISKIPLPFTDSISSDTCKQSFTEWTLDKLQAVDLTNKVSEGKDGTWTDNTAAGSRVGNHCQISAKYVPVSERAQASDTIGRSNELAYQVMRRQQELRRDVEAIALSPQASLPDTGSVAGTAGGFPAWLVGDASTAPGSEDTREIGETYYAGTGGSSTGFNYTTGVVDTITNGTVRALTEKLVRDAVESSYGLGGNPTKLMSTPAVIRKLSEYMFTSSARIGTITSDQGKSEAKASALGAVNVFVSDFGTLEFIPNRLQQLYNSDTAAHVFIYDPEYVRFSYLQGYQTQPLAKTGFLDKRLMSVDWTLKVLNTGSHAVIADVDPTADVTAS